MNTDQNQPPGVPSPALDDPRVIEALEEYQAAIEAGEKPDRQAFLARHAAVAEALAECLDGLEALHAAGPSAHQPFAEGRAAGAQAEWQPGTPLGDFRIIREVGHGGMGVVYEAEQLSLGRRIALKVLPFALTLDPRQLQRFKNEARAAAHLHHPNIVPVYAVGCERGVHFYAMQYIEGQTLAELISQLRQAAGCPAVRPHPSPLPPTAEPSADTAVGPAAAITTAFSTDAAEFFRSVARLGGQAAAALEYAHQYGVVHRDVKPANLLADGHGRLWVTDFGLAQFQSDAALTVTGDLLGTLRYMSPEQALAKRGLVDHRADIYSLGATLYELLTLEPAYGGRDREELLRQIAFEEPRPPRRRNPAIPADLETIVLKAMAKRVEDRYATAQDLGDDLRRFLEHRPIRAKRPTLVERAAKWSRRHRALVGAAVGLLVLAAVGFAVSTALVARAQWQTQAAYQQLAAEQERTKRAYEAEARQRALDDKNFEQAQRMLDFFTQVSAEELADKPGVQEVRRKLLEAALEYYEDFIDQHGDDPSIGEKLALSHGYVAKILLEIGSRDDALAALEQARQIREKQVRDNPSDPEYRRELSSIYRSLGWLRDGGQLLLLKEPSVRAELKLTDEQVKQVNHLMDRRREVFFRDDRELSQEAWQAKFEELAAQVKALVDGFGPEQARRLKQIVWQQAGAAAFADPEVVEALRLTDEQKKSIREIQEAMRRPMRGAGWPGGPRRGGPPGPPPGERKKPEEVLKSGREQAVNVLTVEQKASWAELIGAPFKGEVRPAFGGPAGPGREPPPRRP
jgi:eukaryotic-like serine/threonine-protein kinase